jgi:hypothetical protein
MVQGFAKTANLCAQLMALKASLIVLADLPALVKWINYTDTEVSEEGNVRVMVEKEPITPEILRQLVNVYGFHNTDHKNIRVVCMCLLCYAGFLRFAELANLRRHLAVV